MEEPGLAAAANGMDHRRKWSPEVASRSFIGFDDGGSHSTRVIG